MPLGRLDQIDRNILEALQQNGRLTNVELAGQVGLSASACLRRVQTLISEGYILGFGARLDPKKLGLGLVAFVQVQIHQDSEAQTDAFRDRIRSMPEVVDCFAVTGNYDFLLKVVAPDLESFENIAMKQLLKTPGVKDVRSSFVLDQVKVSSALPLIFTSVQGD